jgi:glycine dehydrogenase
MREFADRHIGPDESEQQALLDDLGYSSLDALIAAAVPSAIRDDEGLALDACSEVEALTKVRSLAARNEVFTSLIGCGYHDTTTPPVILRNVLENPAWYTAYTPYQPEISQGRLEALWSSRTRRCSTKRRPPRKR